VSKSKSTDVVHSNYHNGAKIISATFRAKYSTYHHYQKKYEKPFNSFNSGLTLAERGTLCHYCHNFLLVDEAENPINSFYFVQSVTHYRILNVPVT
jgi:hypothetical protein